MKFVIFISLLFLSLSGCSPSDENLGTQPISMKADPHVAKIDNGGPSFDKNSELLDAVKLEKAYENGDIVKGYFLALLLFKGYNIEQDQHRGVSILLDTWEKGLVDSGYNLFYAFYDGLGVDKNNTLAIYYLEKSAELGYMKSQRELGLIYAGNSQGVKNILSNDNSKAYYWLNKAASNNDKLSAVTVAGFLSEGRGVDKDEEAALKLLLHSLDMPLGSNTYAYTALGNYYEQGIGTNVNLVKAYTYYDQIQPSMDKDKLRVMQSMTAEQIAKAKRLSLALQKETNAYVMPR